MDIIRLTHENFAETLQKHPLVVVDFWAQWCEPCQSFSRIVTKLANQHSDVLFASVDIEAEQELARDFDIVSIPAVLIVKNQVVIYADSGLIPANTLDELILKAKKLEVQP